MDLFGPSYLLEYAADSVKRRGYISAHADELFEEYSARMDLATIVGKLGKIQNEKKYLVIF